MKHPGLDGKDSGTDCCSWQDRTRVAASSHARLEHPGEARLGGSAPAPP